METLIAVSSGNLGALTVCVGLARAGRNDLVTRLHKAGIRGPRVWLLFKDVFGCDREADGAFAGRLDMNSDEALWAALSQLGYGPEPSP